VKIVLVVEKLLAPSLRHALRTVVKQGGFQRLKKNSVTKFVVISLSPGDTHVDAVGAFRGCCAEVARLEQCQTLPKCDFGNNNCIRPALARRRFAELCSKLPLHAEFVASRRSRGRLLNIPSSKAQKNQSGSVKRNLRQRFTLSPSEIYRCPWH